jgi:uncharacterized protein
MLKESITYTQFRKVALEICNKITIKPDCILAIARGGMFLGAQLAYDLNVKQIHTVNIKYYTGINTRLKNPLLMSGLDLSLLEGRNILIVDDIADTGTTINFLLEIIPSSSKIKIATIYQKEKSTINVDYCWKIINNDTWVDFPWEL